MLNPVQIVMFMLMVYKVYLTFKSHFAQVQCFSSLAKAVTSRGKNDEHL